MTTKVDASHILVKTESEANAIKFDLDHGKKFEDLAMEKSTCPSAKNGGHLGEFSRGQMVKEFDDHYIICPTIIFYKAHDDFTSNQLEEKGEAVEQGFEYNSGTNSHFLTVADITELGKQD